MATAPAAAPLLPVDPPRRATFAHATAFVAGFSVVFVVLGASLGVVGFALQDQMIWFQRVAGVALIILGLHLAELITIPFLMRTYQFGSDAPPPPPTAAPRGRLRKYGHSLFVGSAFSLGWTPCVGPILAGILTLAADGASVAQGTLLLLFYAAGLGIPFLIVGAALGSATALLRRLGPYMSLISIASGVLLVFMGMLIVLDNVRVLNDSFTFIPSTEDTGAATVTGAFGFGIAFLGGLLSFLSPCVLPLVPVYLGHLAGVGAQEASRQVQRESDAPPSAPADRPLAPPAAWQHLPRRLALPYEHDEHLAPRGPPILRRAAGQRPRLRLVKRVRPRVDPQGPGSPAPARSAPRRRGVAAGGDRRCRPRRPASRSGPRS